MPDADLYLSAVALGEIQAGIEPTRERDPAKAAEIEAWLEQVAGSRNILPLDGPSFRCWAKLLHKRSAPPIEDAMIAATAATHALTIVTRNIRDFASLGVTAFNPFEAPAP